MAGNKDVTLVKDSIHNPDEARHFMTITPVQKKYQIFLGDELLHEFEEALPLKEVGRSIYDPVLYFPRDEGLLAKFDKIDKTTHCPLKGDASYYTRNGEEVSIGGRAGRMGGISGGCGRWRSRILCRR